ncbi:MAG TPA: AAA family ATPase [Chryseobacterium sp.]|nr:AAA family ATPase [Chryseobacterium sp.]
MENKQLSIFDFLDNPLLASLIGAFPNNESEELEYKSAKLGFPDDFWKTYSAFANTSGGLIILGVREKHDFLQFDGLDATTISRYKKHFWDNVNNLNTTNINLLTDKDIKVINVDGHDLLAFNIPTATRVQRPVHLTRQPFENTYKRNFEGDYRCTREEVRRMLADADTTTHPDSRILEGYSIDDIDLNSLKQFRQLFAAAKTTHPWLTLDNIELLSKLGGYRKDRVSKKEGLTLAGVLMFGKESSIIDPECAPNFFPDFREVLSADPEIRWTDRIYPDGTWEANLFQFYLKVWPRLSASLPKPFQIKEGRRQDETPAHIALREAFINALVHTDYSAPGNLVIEQKTDTFQFSNPGTLLVSLRQYYQGGISECRNPSLQKMFLMIGGAEKAGSGVSKIMQGWQYAHWRNPYIIIESQPDRIILELPMFSILPDETLNDLRHLFGEQIDALGKDELTILAACHIEGEISNSRLQYMLDKHRTDITRTLQDLCKQGYLLSDNKGRWTIYHLNTKYSQENHLDKEHTAVPSDSAIDNLSADITPIIGLESGEKSGEKSSEKSGEKSSEKSGEKSSEKSGEKIHLTNKQNEILKLLINNNRLSVSDIAELWEVNDSTVQRHFENLKSKGAIRRMGPDKGGFWEVLINL